MTRLDLFSTLANVAEEFARLHLTLADRLTPTEDGTFTALVSALDTTIDLLPTMVETEEDDEP